MSDWESKKTVRLGNLGERIVDDYLVSKGVIPYAPASSGAHPFDRLCAYGKETIFIAETKTKPRRAYYPDTGINIKHYLEYLHIQNRHALDVWLFFVDSDLKSVYGNKLRVLDRPHIVAHNGKTLTYPLRHRSVIYFPLDLTKTIITLEDWQINDLKNLSGRKTEYRRIAKQ